MKKNKQDNKVAYLMLAPAIIVLLVVVIYPLFKTIYFSFFNQNSFVGIDNYKVFFQLEYNYFWGTLLNTFVFTVISLCLELILATIVASIINNSKANDRWFKALLMVPIAIPAVAAASNFKLLNSSLIFTDVWRITPVFIIIFLIALRDVEESIYDMAKIQGLNKVTSFFKITLPALKPAILGVIILKFIYSIKVFDIVHVITGENLDSATTSVYAYKTIFLDGQLGIGSALAVVYFVVILIMLFALKKLNPYKIFTEGDEAINEK